MEVECRACNRRLKRWCWYRHERGILHRARMQSGMFNGDTVCVVIEDEEDKKDVGNVDVGEYWNCIGGKMQHVIFAWGRLKNGQRKMRRRLGKWIRTIAKIWRMILKRKRKRIVRLKLIVEFVGAKLGNVGGIGMWRLRNIFWAWIVKIIVWGIATARWDER